MPVNQKASLEAAYVLHQRPYKDTSLLLDVFTANHGRVGLVANGVRKKKGRWQSVLQPFVPVLISWRGRGELQTVTDVEATSGALCLSGKFLFSAFYINELLTYLLHRHDAYPQLFERYHDVLYQLTALQNGSFDSPILEVLLRIFERDLLEIIGYGLALECCVSTGDDIQADKRYQYVLGMGPNIAEGGRERGEFKGASLIALRQGSLDNVDALRDAKRLLKAALDQQLDGRPIKSRQLMLDLLRTTGDNAKANRT
ncbi:DNA repair protein RecO [Pseudomonadota bacterium]